MAVYREKYSETTDLYLQMLRNAQQIEDKKLVKLIVKRIHQTTPALATYVTDSGCEITPFPLPYISRFPARSNPEFWLELKFWKGVALTVGMFGTGVCLVYFPILACI